MANKETVQKTVGVALVLCIVCSLVVSAAAVMLKPAQIANKSLDRKRNILQAAGLLEAGVSVEEQFKKVKTRVVDLRSGQFTDAVAADSYNQDKAAKDSSLSQKLTGEQDLAKIGRLEHYSLVYVIEREGQLDKLILPVRGYGLWSTLYGFLALENDGNTVAGLGFYQHGETPGLGGEVDNPRWKALWVGKEIYKDGAAAIHLIKGTVDPSSTGAENQIDGLAGATLTSRGVTNLMQFWMGEMGYQLFLDNLRKGEA